MNLNLATRLTRPQTCASISVVTAVDFLKGNGCRLESGEGGDSYGRRFQAFLFMTQVRNTFLDPDSSSLVL